MRNVIHVVHLLDANLERISFGILKSFNNNGYRVYRASDRGLLCAPLLFRRVCMCPKP